MMETVDREDKAERLSEKLACGARVTPWVLLNVLTVVPQLTVDPEQRVGS